MPPKKTRVSYKISKLVKEGIKHNKAVAIALSLDQKGMLGPRGGIIKKSKKRRSKKKSKSKKRRYKYGSKKRTYKYGSKNKNK
tara:strand:+ start:372 stop:620 length:249 start_codon:yes stop_codon:yes gene_type:complete